MHVSVIVCNVAASKYQHYCDLICYCDYAMLLLYVAASESKVCMYPLLKLLLEIAVIAVV